MFLICLVPPESPQDLRAMDMGMDILPLEDLTLDDQCITLPTTGTLESPCHLTDSMARLLHSQRQ